MTQNLSADQQGNVEERNAVGDFIYQVTTDSSSTAIGGALVVGAQAVVAKITGGGKDAQSGESTGR